jgi:hypothetical protein
MSTDEVINTTTVAEFIKIDINRITVNGDLTLANNSILAIAPRDFTDVTRPVIVNGRAKISGALVLLFDWNGVPKNGNPFYWYPINASGGVEGVFDIPCM